MEYIPIRQQTVSYDIFDEPAEQGASAGDFASPDGRHGRQLPPVANQPGGPGRKPLNKVIPTTSVTVDGPGDIVDGRVGQDESEHEDGSPIDESPEEGLERLTTLVSTLKLRATAREAHCTATIAALARADEAEIAVLTPRDGVPSSGASINAASMEIERCKGEVTLAKRFVRQGRELLAQATAKQAEAALAVRPTMGTAATVEEPAAPRRSGRARGATGARNPPGKAASVAVQDIPPPSPPQTGFTRQHTSPLHGDGSQRGQDAINAVGPPPSSPSRLVLPGTPSSSQGQSWEEREADAYTEEKSLKAQLDMQAATTQAVAVLEHAHARFPGIKEALLRRMTGQSRPGNLHLLPIAAIAALAQAQQQQNTALVVCQRSAMADQPTGSQRGKTLARLLGHEATFDMQAARLIENPTFPVTQWIAELIAGVIPLAALALEIIRQHHCLQTGVTDDKDIYVTAERMQLSVESKLSILQESGHLFFEAYAEYKQEKRPFVPGTVYRTLAGHIARASGLHFLHDDRSWAKEATAWTQQVSKRLPEAQGGPAPTMRELDRLVLFLQEFGAMVEEQSSDFAQIGKTDERGVRKIAVDNPVQASAPESADDDVGGYDTLHSDIDEFLENARAVAIALQGRYGIEGLPETWYPRHKTHDGEAMRQCWDPTCHERVRPMWLVCQGCRTLNPDIIRCHGPGAMHYAVGACRRQACVTARSAITPVIGDSTAEGIAVFSCMARIQDPLGLRGRKEIAQERPMSRRQQIE